MRFNFLLFLLGLAGLVMMFAPLPVQSSPPVEREFRIEASQYAYSPGEISVNPGDTVKIHLVSTDVVHGLYVDEYGVSITADPGQTATLTFVADKPGSFRLRCNVTCGAMHPLHDWQTVCWPQPVVLPFGGSGCVGDPFDCLLETF